MTCAPIAPGASAARSSESWPASARVWAVDRRHDGLVEDVDIQVEPDAIQLRRADDAGPAQPFSLPAADRVGCRNYAAEQAVCLSQVLIIVAAADMHGVRGPEVRAQAVNVGDSRPVQSHRGRQILAGQARAASGIARVAEVGVTVEVHQAEPSSPCLACVRRARRRSADCSPAKDERNVAGGAQQLDPPGQAPGILDDGILIAQPAGDRVVAVPARQHDTAIQRAMPRPQDVQAPPGYAPPGVSALPSSLTLGSRATRSRARKNAPSCQSSVARMECSRS